MRLILDGDTVEELDVAIRVARQTGIFGTLAVGQRRGFISFDKDGEPTHKTDIIKTKTGYSFKTRRIDDDHPDSRHRSGRVAI